jgi:hypothetical protein
MAGFFVGIKMIWYNQYLGISFDHPPAGFDYVMQHTLQADLDV